MTMIVSWTIENKLVYLRSILVYDYDIEKRIVYLWAIENNLVYLWAILAGHFLVLLW